MIDETLRDLEYTAIRFAGGLSYKVYKELLSYNLINSHRDLTMEKLHKLYDKELDSKYSRNAIQRVLDKEDKIKDALSNYVKSVNENNIGVVSVLDKEYPAMWENLSGMPTVFFTRGDKSIIEKCYTNGSASIVGSRVPSRYSLYATEQFVKDLVEKDIVIVSGGALGIDARAHEAALNNKGKTILVSPCGLDLVYPYKNKHIFNSIYKSGLVMSEMPPGQQALKQYFPARNRLISALSDLCLVMEAGLFSGTLHTASFSADFGRDVFVLPNNIYVENCHGGLKLLQDGAEVLINSEDVIDRVASRVLERLQRKIYDDSTSDYDELSCIRGMVLDDPSSVTNEEYKLLICDELSDRPKTVDEILVAIPIPFNMLLSFISELEMEGKLENSAGKYFLTIH